MKISINKSSNYSPKIIFVNNRINTLGKSERMLRDSVFRKMFADSRLKIYLEECFASFGVGERKKGTETVNAFDLPDFRCSPGEFF
jgi:hypothetical protein